MKFEEERLRHPLTRFSLPSDVPDLAEVSLTLSSWATLSRPAGEPEPEFHDRVLVTNEGISILARPGEEIHVRWVAPGGKQGDLPPAPSDKFYYEKLSSFTATTYSNQRDYLVTENGELEDITEPFPDNRWWRMFWPTGSSQRYFILEYLIALPVLLFVIWAWWWKGQDAVFIITGACAVASAASLAGRWLVKNAAGVTRNKRTATQSVLYYFLLSLVGLGALSLFFGAFKGAFHLVGASGYGGLQDALAWVLFFFIVIVPSAIRDQMEEASTVYDFKWTDLILIYISALYGFVSMFGFGGGLVWSSALGLLLAPLFLIRELGLDKSQ